MYLWPYIEADFQRDYRIDLTTTKMTWRKFLVLYRGLTPRGSVGSHYDRIAKELGIKTKESANAEVTMWRTVTQLGKPGETAKKGDV